MCGPDYVCKLNREYCANLHNIVVWLRRRFPVAFYYAENDKNYWLAYTITIGDAKATPRLRENDDIIHLAIQAQRMSLESPAFRSWGSISPRTIAGDVEFMARNNPVQEPEFWHATKAKRRRVQRPRVDLRR